MNLNKDELNSQNFKPKDNSSFKYIDKTYLRDLFIDRLDENSIFIDGIKKFNLIRKKIILMLSNMKCSYKTSSINKIN